MHPALISLCICLLSMFLSVSQWPCPCHSLYFSLLSFFLCLPLCLQRTPKRAAVHFSHLASFLTFLLFFAACLLPVQHKGPLKKDCKAGDCSSWWRAVQEIPSHQRQRERWRWGAGAWRKGLRRLHWWRLAFHSAFHQYSVSMSVCLCNWKTAEVKTSDVVPAGATAVEGPTCTHLQSRALSLLSWGHRISQVGGDPRRLSSPTCYSS